AVFAHTDVDLRQGVQARQVQGVDEHAELHAVADREGQLLQQRAAGRVLAAERLDEAGQLRPVHVEQGARHQLGDPAALPGGGAEGTVVHGLDQLHVRFGEQRADDAGDEVGGELAQVGVDEADDVAPG